MHNKKKIAVIGGGAAGFFAAINCAETNPDCQVVIIERSKSVLEKVRISGGGRCNVTHHCFDARELVKNYPRGSRELLGPFLRFGPADTIEWFERRGVRLKTEPDGRMFPISDDSATIVHCLWQSAAKAGVKVLTSTRVERINLLDNGQWSLYFNGENVLFDQLMIASGSSNQVWEWLKSLGHDIVTPVPSLFTFNTKDTRLRDLSGVSVTQVSLDIMGTRLRANGPLLVTHWGLSGPAILRLSAWGARELSDKNYHFSLKINFLDHIESDEAAAILQQLKIEMGKKSILANAQFGLPQRLWQNLCADLAITPEQRWAELDKKTLNALCQQLCAATFTINGKSTFKEEFVTAGGVNLKEINFKHFSSRILPNLFLAGEVLDIDGITGGFNFQAAWTGGWLAGMAMAEMV
jgi:predicted Rossmann fold flavoprotein